MRCHAACAVLATIPLVAPGVCPAQQAPRSERVFDADGVRIRYLVQGSGTAVLLVHGFAVNAELNWAEPGVLDSLASTFMVIAPDLRGHGQSDKPHDPRGYGGRFVDDLVRLLDHLRIDRAHVVGYSMGAAVTLKLLTSHPDRVISAVLGGGGWRPPGQAPPEWSLQWMDGLDRAAREGTSVADVIRRPDWPTLRPETRAAIDRNDPRALAAVLRGAAGLAVPEQALRSNRVPILALVGENDLLAQGAVDTMAAFMSNLTVTHIPDANHVTAVGEPRFASAVVAFFRSH